MALPGWATRGRGGGILDVPGPHLCLPRVPPPSNPKQPCQCPVNHHPGPPLSGHRKEARACFLLRFLLWSNTHNVKRAICTILSVQFRGVKQIRVVKPSVFTFPSSQTDTLPPGACAQRCCGRGVQVSLRPRFQFFWVQTQEWNRWVTW